MDFKCYSNSKERLLKHLSFTKYNNLIISSVTNILQPSETDSWRDIKCLQIKWNKQGWKKVKYDKNVIVFFLNKEPHQNKVFMLHHVWRCTFLSKEPVLCSVETNKMAVENLMNSSWMVHEQQFGQIGSWTVHEPGSWIWFH